MGTKSKGTVPPPLGGESRLYNVHDDSVGRRVLLMLHAAIGGNPMFSKNKFVLFLSATVLVISAVGIPLSATAGPERALDLKAHMTPQDTGPAAQSNLITTSIILKVTHPQELANFIQATVTPGDEHYHQFLSVEEFSERFAPSERNIRQLVRYLQSFGIRVTKIYRDHLDITASGTVAEFNAAFSTSIHEYAKDGEHFRRPDREPTVPAALAHLVLAVTGLSNEARFHPMNMRLGRGAYAQITPPAVAWPRNSTATGVPQEYTVGDVANMYNVNPLYQAGLEGRGETVGIMTLADFNEADVYAYWRDIGLKVKPNRIKKVRVDGGTPVAAGVGDDETSLDVEQSGGLAPQADIRVYIAPNTNDGFLDLFYTAMSQNRADTLSISWGQAEELYFAALNNGVDITDQLRAINQALMEGAAQGQSIFAAAGDAGAYDVNRVAPFPQFSMQLTVDAPASAPYITAAGGTTAAATIPGIPQLGCPNIVISPEQVWGWDYLNNDWASCLGLPPDALFPVGGGGGVSSFWPVPYYQQSVAGMQQTQPGQSLIYYPNYPSTSGAQDLIDLPANFAGRNLPDLSLNADPETGFIVVDCTDFPAPANPFCAATGFGGTSFVAPQLNGITALIDQASGGRVGFLNPVLYTVQQAFGYGRHAPFRDIIAGDNWFYPGVPGYDDGSGIGTINATNLALTYVFLNSLGSDD